MPFKKGVSGNPSGRPNKTRITAVGIFNDVANEPGKDPNKTKLEEVVRNLFVVASSGKSVTAMKASAIIFDRLFGKPLERVLTSEVDLLKDEELLQMFSQEELENYAKRIETRNFEKSSTDGDITSQEFIL